MRQVVSKIEPFDPHRVRPLKGQPRVRFRGIRELADSILEIGQTNLGKVILINGDPDFDAILVDGERRLEACKLAGVLFEAVVVENLGDDDQIFTLSFASNFGKQPHDCLEIATSLGRLRKMGKSQKQMATICSASTAWVSQHLAILDLDPDVQKFLIPVEPSNTQAVPSANGDGDTDHDEQPARVTLPLSLVPLLIKLPAKVQKQVMRQIISKGMSLLAAQRLIMKKLHQHGIHVEHTHRIRRMKPISDVIKLVDQRLGIYLDLVTNKQFGIVLEKMSPRDKQRLVESINNVNDHLSEIADAVEIDLKAKSTKGPLVKVPPSRQVAPPIKKPVEQRHHRTVW